MQDKDRDHHHPYHLRSWLKCTFMSLFLFLGGALVKDVSCPSPAGVYSSLLLSFSFYTFPGFFTPWWFFFFFFECIVNYILINLKYFVSVCVSEMYFIIHLIQIVRVSLLFSIFNVCVPALWNCRYHRKCAQIILIDVFFFLNAYSIHLKCF